MKNKYIRPFQIVALGMGLFMASCASAPKTEPSPVPAPESAPSPVPSAAVAVQVDPNQAALSALATAKARAEAARQKTTDFEGSSYFPGEVEAAEAGYIAAGGQALDTPDGIRQAEAGYNAAADSFEEIFSKTIPLYAQDRENEIIAARNEAVSAGIDGLYPEFLRTADSVALDAVDKYEAGDYYAADTAAASGLEMYQTLKTGMDAYNVRQEISSRGFEDADRENYNRADEALIAAFDSFESGSTELALAEAGEAQFRYNLVLSAGWAVAAGRERQNALDVKANIAAQNEFDAAEKLYNQAEAERKAEEYGESARLYRQSASRFVVLAETVTEKRRIAAEAIRTAEKKMAESEENARDAELILEGGV